ncbi:MAG: HigA family addiction module antitoxin [Leptospirales bacterium]
MRSPISPPHPGRVLVEEFLEPLGITQTAFSNHLGWTFARLNEIVNARRGITPDSALHLSEALAGTSPEFWLDLQRNWDLWQARSVHSTSAPHSLVLTAEGRDIIRKALRNQGWKTGPLESIPKE